MAMPRAMGLGMGMDLTVMGTRTAAAWATAPMAPEMAAGTAAAMGLETAPATAQATAPVTPRGLTEKQNAPDARQRDRGTKTRMKGNHEITNKSSQEER
jgi:hypothetical protein